MKKIVNKLIKNKETISTMESCTGGMLASEITNVSGSSEILKFSAVTYSNEFKIKMGVSSKTIDKYSVYSMETAMEMSKNISLFTNSDYGVGITGKLNRIDKANLVGEDNVIYVSIYIKEKNDYCNFSLKAIKNSRIENKELIVKEIENKLLSII